MKKLLATLLSVLSFLVLFSQTDSCWQVSDKRKQIFAQYISEKAGDLEIYLKATSNKNCAEPEIFFIRRDIYKQHLISSKGTTASSVVDTLRSKVETGIVLDSKEAFLFNQYKMDINLYDSLQTKPLPELLNFFFSQEDGAIWPKYYHIYSHPLALILFDHYIVFSYSGKAGIVPRFYIDLLRSGCFKR
jgi:hypothetical protein